MASFQWQSKRLVVAIVLGKRDPEDTDDGDDLAGFVSLNSGDYTPAPQLQVLWDEEDDSPSEFRFGFAGVEG